MAWRAQPRVQQAHPVPFIRAHSARRVKYLKGARGWGRGSRQAGVGGGGQEGKGWDLQKLMELSHGRPMAPGGLRGPK